MKSKELNNDDLVGMLGELLKKSPVKKSKKK